MDEASIERYRDQGYIALPKLFDAAEVKSASDALTSVMQSMLAAAKNGAADYKPPTGGTGNYDGAKISLPGKKTSLLFEHSFDPMAASEEAALAHVRNVYYYDQEHPHFAEMVKSQRIQGIAREFFGEEAVLFQSMALVKPALIGSEKPWHQDNAYFKYAPLDQVCGFWMALDDATVDNGCMHVLPGWHRRGGLEHFHAGDCQILPDRLTSASAVPVPLPAGGAMFFSGMMPHQTPQNRSPKSRRAIQFHYRAASTKVVNQAEYDRLFAEADGTPASCAAAVAR